MEEIQIFNHEEFGEIRTIEIDGQIYFVGVDVTKALGYKTNQKALRDHVDEEDKKILNLNTVLNQNGIRKVGNPNVTVINESGLYCLILASKLEGSKKFKRWVTSEVIPAIRKTGSYRLEPPKIEDKTTIYIDTVNIEKLYVSKKKDVNFMEVKDQIKEFLLDYVKEITPQSKTSPNQFVCPFPFCRSGTGSHHTGAFTVYPDTNTYYCFSCGQSGDIFSLYAEMNELDIKSDFQTILSELAAKYNILIDDNRRSAAPSSANKKPPKQQDKNYTKFFYVMQQNLTATDYLTKRGISLETQKKFGCGYTPSFTYKNGQTTPAVIIPTSDTSFMWRSTTENIKQKRGTAHILNTQALKNEYCFVVEGEIDCMSIDECGFPCIGLGSTSNIGKIFDYDVSDTVLILAFDDDQAGVKAASNLERLCKEHNTFYITTPKDFWNGCKDANELLVKDRQSLIKNLQEYSERALNLDKDNWLSQPSEKNDLARTTNRKKIPLEDYKQFEEFIESCGYSIRYNQITHNFEFYGFDKGESKEHLAENVPSILKDNLKKHFSRVSRQDVIDYITRYATRHKFNPVLDLIKSTKYDEKDHVTEIYDIFKIPADTEEGIYSRIYIQKWLMQCICGLFNDIENPFSLDIILVFQGRQGIGKTRFLEKLALKSQYFGEGICLDPRDKDSIIQATSKWICELGELGSTMKKDMDSVKAFLTKSTDEYRTPYGKASLHYPRMTSFVGTVNDEQFLIDQTGNRRFVTIPLPLDLVIDYETQIKPFDSLQLWSQVYYMVKDKDKSSCFRLSEDEKRHLEKRNSSFMKPMKGEYEVLDILEEQQTPEQGYKCTFKEMTVLQFIQQHNLKYDANVIGKVLKKYGYEAKRKKINGETVRVIKLPHKEYSN